MVSALVYHDLHLVKWIVLPLWYIKLCLGNSLSDGGIVIPKRDTTMLQGIGRFTNRPTKTGRRVYDKFFVYIPTEIARDGLFPFKAGDEILVKVDPKLKRLVLERSSR
jgi:hypothetical protein